MRYYIIFILLALIAAFNGWADDYTDAPDDITELEEDIRYHEILITERKDTIADIERQIAELKTRIDSLNATVKGLKVQVGDLERAQKALEAANKQSSKARKTAFEMRDQMVYDEYILPVLGEPFDKHAVETALRNFEGMETSDILKREPLVSNYGKYTAEIRSMLEKQRDNFNKLRWATQGSDSEPYKRFDKALKGLDYYKIYDKGMKSTKNATIPYLDKVINAILLLERHGFNSQQEYDAVMDMLYAR